MPARACWLARKQYYNQKIKPLNELAKTKEDTVDISLEELGIVESEKLSDAQKYPFVKERKTKRALAVLEIIAISNSLPFKKDLVRKFLKNNLEKKSHLHLI